MANTKKFGKEEVEKECTCIDCKGQFDLTKGEVDWYKAKGYPEPKRCAICREKRRQQKIDEENNNRGY